MLPHSLVLATALLVAPMVAGAAPLPFKVEVKADLAEPWAMTFLPDGRMLVTEKKGELLSLDGNGKVAGKIAGVPKVAYGGQGGLGDVILHPGFAKNGIIYLSYAEAGPGDTAGTAVARARLVLGKAGGSLQDLKVIWRQSPKVSGRGHYSGRMAFAPDGHLFITSGERQKFTPAQDMKQNLGKVIRLTDTGGVPADNPFAKQGGVTAQIWSLGHRNLLGIAFDADGRLWEQEMGPKGGDEVNLILKGRNYGWPVVSNGSHYDGRDIPDHPTRPEFEAPKVSWNPVISPGGLMIYSGAMFPAWKGSAFIGGLSSESLVRVALKGDGATKADQWGMGARIREVEQGPDGAIWLLEDGGQGSPGRLLRLTPD
ncbi:PQQ-dependent sugar dehydrogenase [Sphingomonas montanisoli]|uniref:PQQ-dependent sugar dehydrogenase n=1 Tax=Sphingomonas montanisoli TaxID=2606412 RepID=A0A5D9C329_9SPHN|nr:PQQ-dependent sugar dehydrogenase [Sphingomonas montanisoli]